MKDIAIFGAGGWGKEVACLIKEINKISIDKWNLIGFFDDAEDKKDYISKYGNCFFNLKCIIHNIFI